MSKESATFTPTHAREHITNSADCLQESIQTLNRVVRRFPMETTAFPHVLKKIAELRDELKRMAVEFEMEVEMKSAGASPSRKVPESCRPSA